MRGFFCYTCWASQKFYRIPGVLKSYHRMTGTIKKAPQLESSILYVPTS